MASVVPHHSGVGGVVSRATDLEAHGGMEDLGTSGSTRLSQTDAFPV